MDMPTPQTKSIPAWRRYGHEGLLIGRLGLANLRLHWWYLPLVVGIGAMVVLADRGGWEEQLFHRIRQPDNEYITRFAKFLSSSADVTWTLLLAAILFIQGVAFGRPRWRQMAWACLFALLMSGLIVNLFRPMFGRARPNSGLPGDFYGPSMDSKFHGFPSGHATSAFAPAAAVMAAAPLLGVPCMILAGKISWSRLQLNRHRPLDVMTGAALGTVIGLCFGSTVEGARFRLRRRQRALLEGKASSPNLQAPEKHQSPNTKESSPERP